MFINLRTFIIQIDFNFYYKKVMKKSAVFLSMFFVLQLFFSCGYTNYYQISTIETDLKKNSDNIKYENNDCIVYYNLWSKGGNLSYTIYNKTDSCIFLCIDKSFFVKNDYAYDMYDPNIYSYSKSVNKGYTVNSGKYKSMGVSVNGKIIYPFNISGLNGTFSSATVNYKDYGENIMMENTNTTFIVNKKIICIPPKTMKYISGYVIELARYDGFSNEEKIIEFNRQNTPLVIRNIIEYSFDKDCKQTYVINNDFWLSKIEECSDKKGRNSLKTDNEYYSVRRENVVHNFILKPMANKFYITWTEDNIK